MDYAFTSEAIAFEREVRTFLDSEWSPEIRMQAGIEGDNYDAERGFRKKLAQRGWLTMAWPAEYGGQRRSFEEMYLFQEACNYVGAPKATVAERGHAQHHRHKRVRSPPGVGSGLSSIRMR